MLVSLLVVWLAIPCVPLVSVWQSHGLHFKLFFIIFCFDDILALALTGFAGSANVWVFSMIIEKNSVLIITLAKVTFIVNFMKVKIWTGVGNHYYPTPVQAIHVWPGL